MAEWRKHLAGEGEWVRKREPIERAIAEISGGGRKIAASIFDQAYIERSLRWQEDEWDDQARSGFAKQTVEEFLSQLEGLFAELEPQPDTLPFQWVELPLAVHIARRKGLQGSQREIRNSLWTAGETGKIKTNASFQPPNPAEFSGSDQFIETLRNWAEVDLYFNLQNMLKYCTDREDTDKGKVSPDWEKKLEECLPKKEHFPKVRDFIVYCSEHIYDEGLDYGDFMSEREKEELKEKYRRFARVDEDKLPSKSTFENWGRRCKNRARVLRERDIWQKETKPNSKRPSN